MEERKKRSWCQWYQQDISLCEENTAELLLSSPARSPLQGQLPIPPLPPPSSQRPPLFSQEVCHRELYRNTLEAQQHIQVEVIAVLFSLRLAGKRRAFAKCFLPARAACVEKGWASSCSAGCIKLDLSQSPAETLCIPEEAVGFLRAADTGHYVC